MIQRFFRTLAQAACVLFVGCGALLHAAELPTLTTAEAVRQLSPEEAAKGYPVKLRGIVTFRARGWLAFLQDETAGIYLRPPYPKADGKELLLPGSLCEVEGATVAGRFAPYIAGAGELPLKITRFGFAPLPAPKRLSPDQLNDSRNHCQFIEVGGVVRSMESARDAESGEKIVGVSVGSGETRFVAGLYGKGVEAKIPPGFLGSTVTVRGVFGTLFNDKRQFVGMRLFVNSFEDFAIQQRGPLDPFAELPVRPLASLMQFSGDDSAQALARVRGTVALVLPGRGFFLESEGRGLWIETAHPPEAVRTSDAGQAVGFPAWGECSPILQDAIWRTEAAAALPEAPVISAEEALRGDFDSRRVRMEALLLDVPARGQAPTLLLQSGGKVFLARFSVAAGAEALGRLKPNSSVQITGICVDKRNPSDSKIALAGADSEMKVKPLTFEMLAASPADVIVLHAPSWWTRERLLAAAAGVAILMLAALAWGVALRRRVTAQTEVIRDQLSRQTLLQERTRMARELHDTLEQELMGLSLQLDAATDTLPSSPATAQRALGTAQALLKHTRAEARRSIWDLRASALESGDLAAALREIVRPMNGERRPAISVEVRGTPRRLAPKIEANLLRIGSEAVTNAVKHAGAAHIEVALEFSPEEVALRIRDDGRGFDTTKALKLSEGHYGLLGMRERAEHIAGRLELHAAAGTGTELTVRVKNEPLPAQS